MRRALCLICLLALIDPPAARALPFADWLLEAQDIFIDAGAASTRIDAAMNRLERVRTGEIPVEIATRSALETYFEIEGTIATVAARVTALGEVETDQPAYRRHAADLTAQLRQLPAILEEERTLLHEAVDAVADADWAVFEDLAIRAIGQSTRWLIIENLILEGALDRLMHDHPQYSLNRAIVAENRAVIRVIEFYAAIATGEEADPAVYAATVEGFLNEAEGAVDRGRRHAAAIIREFEELQATSDLPPAMVERAIASIETYRTSFDTEERVIDAIRASFGPAPETVSLEAEPADLLAELRDLEQRFYALVMQRIDQQTLRYRFLETTLDDTAEAAE